MMLSLNKCCCWLSFPSVRESTARPVLCHASAIPDGMNSCASLLFWGFRRLPRTVRAVRYACGGFCKWGELYLSWPESVNSDKTDIADYGLLF
jgi:hypothetical protein